MKQTILEIQYDIMKQYKNVIDFRVCNQEIAYCYIPERIVYMCSNDFINPTAESLFDLLHEIGHILTNTYNMKRCEEEYYATQWAIKEMKKLEFQISHKRKKEFQNYIWKWRETGIKLKAKNMPSKEQLILEW